ncbi:DUF4870 domain-containing protein [Chitinophaga tropicalis]|uniref:DUF4870 domain-containing protein n=1 Tax=Chitinophaga tropicalis TaxID=2683588 RepID=A0A7K1U196_9BACT|nr:DUF4870 domain-containing protein [Chitinophaga tropicalis]MVT08070.1 DUF4870 domain-containing protein [Chitinophaga tropicalis]
MQQKDERTWGVLMHLSGLIGMAVIPPVGNIIGALVCWLIKRNESSLLDDQGKEALNFQITLSIARVALNFLLFITAGQWFYGNNRFIMDMDDFSFPSFSFFSIFTTGRAIIWLLNIIFSVIAAVRANEGRSYKYPISLRLVK